MGGKRNRRRGPADDWEASESDEGYANASGSHSKSETPITGAVGERETRYGNEQTENHNGGGQGRRGKERHPFQPQDKSALVPWTQAVGETVQEMNGALRSITKLQGLFSTHMKDLGEMDDIKTRLEELEEECKEKNREIQEQESAIRTLRVMDQRAKSEMETELENIARDREKLEQDRAKLESRIEVATAEERLKMEHEFKDRKAKHDKSHEARMKELDAEYDRMRAENSKIVTDLADEKERLSTIVEQQKSTIKTQAGELEKINEQYDVLQRAKNSLRTETQTLKTELEVMKKEFSFDTKAASYFEKKFAEIYTQIEAISSKYFHDIEGKNLDKMHEQLTAADSCFQYVPIDDSDDSRDLCIAHAQRIISKAICEDIWTPFSSDLTVFQPESRSLLVKISDCLENSSRNGRTAHAWTALTTRALHSLKSDTVALPVPNSKQHFPPTGSVRADHVMSKVFSVLSSLVNPAQSERLGVELLAVIESSIDVWNNAQAGGLKIIVNPVLDRANRDEWRAQQFDPISSSRDGDGPDPDHISNTRPRVFTLFPRILARIQDEVPPGSWPQPELRVVYPGVGLPEWSALVVRGKDEQEDKREYLAQVMENAKKELQNTRRAPGHGRRESRGSLTSGPPSPTAQWKAEGAMKYVEK